MAGAARWFHLPDDDQHESVLMGLKPGQLRCYLVVARAIQHDRDSGKLSVREISSRAQLSGRHAHEALSGLVACGLLRCVSRPGSTAVYSLPIALRGESGSSAGEPRLPTGEQLGLDPPIRADCIPVGTQQHSELLSELEFERGMRVLAGLASGRGWRQVELYSRCRQCAGFGRRLDTRGGPPCSCSAGEAFSQRSGSLERAGIDSGFQGVKHAAGR